MNIVKITKKTTGRLWNYYRDESTNPISSNSESFKYKNNVTGNTYNVDGKITDDDGNQVDNPIYDANKVGKNEIEVVIPLKNLSNFWRSSNIPLTNSEIEFILTWSKNCVVDIRPANYPPTRLEFKITDAKLYFPLVTLSKENDTKLLEQLKSRFKRNIKWNKYSSQMTTQSQNNNLNYLIDPTFTNVNKLFVLFFLRNNNTDNRDSFSNYYVPTIEIKYFNNLD